MNERTPLFVSDLHLIGLIIQKGKKNLLVFPSFIQRIIIPWWCISKPNREWWKKTKRHSKAQLLITSFCHCFHIHAIHYVCWFLYTHTHKRREEERNNCESQWQSKWNEFSFESVFISKTIDPPGEDHIQIVHSISPLLQSHKNSASVFAFRFAVNQVCVFLECIHRCERPYHRRFCLYTQCENNENDCANCYFVESIESHRISRINTQASDLIKFPVFLCDAYTGSWYINIEINIRIPNHKFVLIIYH